MGQTVLEGDELSSVRRLKAEDISPPIKDEAVVTVSCSDRKLAFEGFPCQKTYHPGINQTQTCLAPATVAKSHALFPAYQQILKIMPHQSKLTDLLRVRKTNKL